MHESGIYVFESKNYSGWIFGTETQQYWTQTLLSGKGRSQKRQFFNPMYQGRNFLGCSNFPKCRYTESLSDK
ncbi:NERD domain-containing protein [Candidatus Merdisoma sp. JLR.KK006]|uniref:nuclease-related domain-containing protein n=1 Tax=Candidatus Merdisoma sp. JLR.KK006 TaxID=3112626 RepID=UPI003312FD2A